MSRLDRAAFLSKSALKRKDVDLPGMGTVSVRELSAGEVGEYAAKEKAGGEEIDLLAWLFVRVVCDEHGKPLFSDSDLATVKGMGLPVLKKPAIEAARMSGIAPDDPSKKTRAAKPA